ncbi:MAG: BatA and WFA domain-containing protein [Acidobacteria bacterium]|nr:BatA and WFA domain-containing protein [Acidobacteriota bacterium]
MGFLVPLFFAGLAALAVPVLVHLIQREKNTVVAFPSLMFVRRVPYESVRRRKIRHWALLALRLLALALIVAAFARPFVRGSAAIMAGGAREVVVLVDRSYSMGYGTRWARAQAAAQGVVDALGQGDRASLVFFGTGAEVALQSIDDRARLEAALGAATPGAESTRYSPALRVAGTIVSESTRPRKEVVLISDFQKLAWAPSDDDRLPAGTVLTPVAITDTDTRNLSVTPVAVRRSRFEGQERATVTGGVTNRGSGAAEGATLALELNGRVVETLRVTAAPQASAAATFAPVTLTPEPIRAVVRLADDALAADNAFHFVLAPTRPIAVLLASAGGRGPDDTYLRRALAIGESPRFDVTVTTVDQLTDDALARVNVLIVHDAPLGDAVAGRVLGFAERGGGVFLIAGPRASWPQGAGFPGALAAPVDRTRGEVGRLGGLEFGHAVFAPFRAARSGDFSSVRVYGYRRLTAAAAAQVLARYDDGLPALAVTPAGLGKMMTWTSSVDLAWNDLALKPVFLPFVHQVVRTLSGFEERPAALTVGQVATPDTPADPARPRLAIGPDAVRTPLDASRGDTFEVARPGFYEIRSAATDGAVSSIVAANVDVAESDLASVDPATVTAAVTGAGDAVRAARAGAEPPRDEVTEQSQRLWWYLLLAGMLLLIGETLVASRLSGGAA